MGEIISDLLSTRRDGAGQAERLHTDAHEDLISSTSSEIPVIVLADLDGPGRAGISEEIAKACESYGFFQIVNHGVDPNLMDKLRHVSNAFFHLPQEEKLNYVKTPDNIQGYGHTDMKEKTTNKLILASNDYFYFLNPMSRRQEDLWPRNPPEFRETMAQYGKEVRVLAERLLSVMSEILGLQSNTLKEKLTVPSGEPVNSVRANFYAPCETDDLLALGRHSDPGGITLLLQDDGAAGTQVKINDEWITVQPALNGFCINVGDQIEILTNGRFKSIEHQGLACRGRERLTIPFFYNPAFDSLIGPLEELVDESHPALFSSATYEHYFFNVFLRRGVGAGKSYINETRV